MTDRELMQQALDAMLNFPNDISDEIFESIRVLRARLAEPPCKTGSQCVGGKCERCAEQEPVAWLDENVYSWIPGELPDEWAKHCKPLYTAPPQRDWQGLTDEEIVKLQHLIDWTAGWSYGNFARAIEAKLREKNGG